FDDDGNVVATVGSVIDVTDDVRRRQETERLVRSLEATTDIVSFHDPEGRAFFLNRAGRDFFALAADEPVPRPTPTAFLTADEETLTAIGAALEDAGVWQGELELLGAFGRRMPASVVVVAQRGADGRVEHFSAISRDISDIRSFEARLASNEAWYRSL